MIKLTNTYLIGLITASLLVGCGSSDNDNDNDDGGRGIASTSTATPATPTTPTSASVSFGTNVMPVLVNKCQNCHGSNGNFTVTDASSTYANIVAMKGSGTAGGQYVLDKGSNSVGHGGGNVISTSSAEYSTIQSWVKSGALDN